jgi:hypothetical protein
LPSFGADSFDFSLLSKNIKNEIYGTIIFPVVLYGCETWSLTLREEHKLRVLENRVLRRIFGHKRDEVTGEYRKLNKLGVTGRVPLSPGNPLSRGLDSPVNHSVRFGREKKICRVWRESNRDFRTVQLSA